MSDKKKRPTMASLKKEVVRLENENTLFATKIRVLREENQDLKTNNESHKLAMGQMKDNYNKLKIKEFKTKTSLDTMTKSRDNLHELYNDLDERYEKLKTSISSKIEVIGSICDNVVFDLR